MAAETFEGFLSPSQAARVAGVDTATLKYHTKTGKLQAVMVPPGRRLYRTEEIERFARERTERQGHSV